MLILGQDAVIEFVNNCVRERSLSKIMVRLNQELLNGTTTERAEDRKALKRLGFI